MPEQDPSKFEMMKQGFIEAVGGGLERLYSGIDGLKRNADKLKAIGEVALVGLTPVLAFPAAASAEGPVNRSSSEPVAEATASDQRQECIDDGLKFPKPFKAKMIHPGQFNNQNIQQTVITSTYQPEKPECFDQVNDLRQYKLQLKTSKGWHSTNRFWVPLADKKDGTNTVTETALGDDDLYACRPVRVMVRNRVVDANTHKTVAMKVRPKSVQIVGKKKVC
jgi:hypothetical protein